MLQNLTNDKSTLVDGTKPLPGPVLTQIYVITLYHQATMS